MTLPGAGVSLVAVLAAAAFLLLRGGSPAPAGQPSVAVLPLEAVGTAGPEEVSAGLHADLLTRLSSVSGLRVTSASSVERYRDAEKSAAEIADELGVTWLLEGSVQKEHGQIQVNAQLIDPGTETHAWAQRYRRDLTAENLFDLQGEIAREIARSLEARIGPAEEKRLGQVPTRDLEAHRLYVQGRGLLLQRTDSTMRGAVELFRRALERDSSYAVAWAGLADAFTLLAGYRHAPHDSVLPPAREAVRRALELEPDLGEAHTSLGRIRFYEKKLPAALAEVERAIALRPSYATAYEVRSMLKLTQGRPEEALEDARTSVELDPLAPENRVALAWAYLALGHPERALEEARRAQGLQPAYLTGSGLELLALVHLGRKARARSMVEEGHAGEARAAALAWTDAVLGDTVRLRERWTDSMEESHPLWAGHVHAALGRHERALERFEEAFRRREITAGSLTIRYRYFHPEALGPLRADPAWDPFIRRINAAWGLNPDGSLPDRAGEPGRSP